MIVTCLAFVTILSTLPSQVLAIAGKDGVVDSTWQSPSSVVRVFPRHGQSEIAPCSYVVVGARHLLTAGHCTEDLRPFQYVRVQLGDATSEVFNQVSKVTRHPGYQFGFYRLRIPEKIVHAVPFDLAVVEFTSDFEFPTRQAALARGGIGSGSLIFAANGQTEKGRGIGTLTSESILAWFAYSNDQDKVISVPILSLKSKSGTESACIGDSGGGVFESTPNGLQLVGIQSAILGDQTCGIRQVTALVVPIEPNLHWILPALNQPIQ